MRRSAVADRRLIRSGQGLDRCDSNQIFRSMGELPVGCDEGIGLKRRQSDVLGAKRVRSPNLVGALVTTTGTGGWSGCGS